MFTITLAEYCHDTLVLVELMMNVDNEDFHVSWAP